MELNGICQWAHSGRGSETLSSCGQLFWLEYILSQSSQDVNLGELGYLCAVAVGDEPKDGSAPLSSQSRTAPSSPLVPRACFAVPFQDLCTAESGPSLETRALESCLRAMARPSFLLAHPPPNLRTALLHTARLSFLVLWGSTNAPRPLIRVRILLLASWPWPQ